MRTALELFGSLLGLYLLCVIGLALLRLCALKKKLLDCGPKKLHCPHFEWSIGLVTNKTQTKENNGMNIKLTTEQKQTITLNPVTLGGKPVTLDGPPRWSVTSGEGTVVPAEDGLSAVVFSSDKPGDTIIAVEADADLGAGVENIADVIRLTTEGARASSFGMVAGEPELK